MMTLIIKQPMEELEKTEAAVVSCVMSAESAIMQVYPLLKPEMFSHPDIGFVYSAAYSLYEKGLKVDLVTTDNEMRRLDEKHWKAIKGVAVLNEWMVQLRHTANLMQYAEEVKRRYMLRLLSGMFTGLMGKANEFETEYAELIGDAEKKLLAMRESFTVGKPLRQIGQVAGEVWQMHRERLEKGTDSMRILTGIEEFDFVTGGLYNGELTVEAGRPGDGKTAVAMHIAMNVAMSGKHVCFFSLEMTALQTLNRLFAGYADIDANRLRVSGANQADLGRMERLAKDFEKLPIYFDHTPSNSIENIRAQVKLQRRKKKCDLVIVDYLHLVKRERLKNETMDQVIGRIMEALKQLAIEEDIPVLVLSQMNRNSVNRGEKLHLPELHDLRDSGVIEQVADCVYFIYIPTKNGVANDPKTGESLADVGELWIRKTRNGSTGVARYRFNESYTLISNFRKKKK